MNKFFHSWIFNLLMFTYEYATDWKTRGRSASKYVTMRNISVRYLTKNINDVENKQLSKNAVLMQSSMLTLSRQYANPKLNTIQLKVRGKICFFYYLKRDKLNFKNSRKIAFLLEYNFCSKREEWKKL